MNKINKNIINENFESVKKDIDKPPILIFLIFNLFSFIFKVLKDPNVLAIRLFGIIILGFIHSKEDNISGILIGVLNTHLQLTINSNDIYKISILKIFSIGLISNDNHTAYGFIITILGYNIQLMLGLHKSKIKKKKKRLNEHSLIAQA